MITKEQAETVSDEFLKQREAERSRPTRPQTARPGIYTSWGIVLGIAIGLVASIYLHAKYISVPAAMCVGTIIGAYCDDSIRNRYFYGILCGVVVVAFFWWWIASQ
jgi:hypothetical protein